MDFPTHMSRQNGNDNKINVFLMFQFEMGICKSIIQFQRKLFQHIQHISLLVRPTKISFEINIVGLRSTMLLRYQKAHVG